MVPAYNAALYVQIPSRCLWPTPKKKKVSFSAVSGSSHATRFSERKFFFPRYFLIYGEIDVPSSPPFPLSENLFIRGVSFAISSVALAVDIGRADFGGGGGQFHTS